MPGIHQNEQGQDVHVAPCGQRHDMTRRCWCEPLIRWPCAEAVACDKGCFACGGSGWVTSPNGLPAVVVHDDRQVHEQEA